MGAKSPRMMGGRFEAHWLGPEGRSSRSICCSRPLAVAKNQGMAESHRLRRALVGLLEQYPVVWPFLPIILSPLAMGRGPGTPCAEALPVAGLITLRHDFHGGAAGTCSDATRRAASPGVAIVGAALGAEDLSATRAGIETRDRRWDGCCGRHEGGAWQACDVSRAVSLERPGSSSIRGFLSARSVFAGRAARRDFPAPPPHGALLPPFRTADAGIATNGRVSMSRPLAVGIGAMSGFEGARAAGSNSAIASMGRISAVGVTTRSVRASRPCTESVGIRLL